MPYNIPNFRFMDYGNVLAQGENILNARAQRDPNSLKNQLLRAKLQNELNNPDSQGQLSMAPISFKDATAESIAAAMEANDPGLLERVPYKPWSVDTKTHREFYDIHPVTRAPTLITKVPIENFTSAYDTAAGEAFAEAGQPNPNAAPVGQPAATQPPASVTPPSKAEIAGDVKAQQVVGESEGTRETADFQNKQELREMDAANARAMIKEMLAPREDGKGIYASYAYGRENILAPDVLKPQEWVDAEAKRNQLVSMLQLENVAKLKGTGPITEPEQAVLRQAMTVLENNLISSALVERELKRVDTMFAKWEADAKRAQGKASKSKSQEIDLTTMSDEELDAYERQLQAK